MLNIKKLNFPVGMKFIFIFASIFVLLGLCSPAIAGLPIIPTPAGGGIGGAAVQDGDFLGMMGAYFKMGITLLGLVVAGYAFISVVTGGMARWRKYSQGQIEIGDLKEYMVMAVVIMVFVVFMVKYAFETLA